MTEFDEAIRHLLGKAAAHTRVANEAENKVREEISRASNNRANAAELMRAAETLAGGPITIAAAPDYDLDQRPRFVVDRKGDAAVNPIDPAGWPQIRPLWPSSV